LRRPESARDTTRGERSGIEEDRGPREGMRTEKGICNGVDKLGNVGRDFVVYARTISPTAVISAAHGAGEGVEEGGDDLLSSHQSMVAVGIPQKGVSEGTSWMTRAVGRCSCLTSISLSLSLDLVTPAPSRVFTQTVLLSVDLVFRSRVSLVLARGVRGVPDSGQRASCARGKNNACTGDRSDLGVRGGRSCCWGTVVHGRKSGRIDLILEQ
jgi:hypothetical protein